MILRVVKDSQYGTLFEVSWGSAGIDTAHRAEIEGVLFQNAYDDAEPFERPKYGCLNVALIAAGTQQAMQYGDGYLQLKDATVRWRTSVTVGDSFNVRGDTATLKHCNHLLVQLRPDELQEIVEVALNRKAATEGTRQRSYREVQIHGPVRLDRDVESVHAPSSYQNDKELVEQLHAFCDRNKCELRFFEPPTANQHFKEKKD